MIKALKITILLIICVALVGFMIAFISGGFDFKKMKTKLVFDEKYELGELNKINVDVKSSDIYFYKSEDDKINIKVYAREKEKAKVNINNNELSVNMKNKSNVCFGFCFGSKKIEIYVPENYLGEFNVKATSGDIKSNLNTFNKYEINVTSGDIEIDNVSSLTGHATSGDVEIGSINSYINFKTTSGDIDIDDVSLEKDSFIKVTSGDISIDKVNNAYVKTDVKSGDVDIKNNDRHAPFELNIKTTSGDIEVD